MLEMEQVVVCIVADGRMKINPRTRSVLAALGCYQDGVGKNVVNGKPVVRSAPFKSCDMLMYCRQHIFSSTQHSASLLFCCLRGSLISFSCDRWRWDDQAGRYQECADSDDLLHEGEFSRHFMSAGDTDLAAAGEEPEEGQHGGLNGKIDANAKPDKQSSMVL